MAQEAAARVGRSTGVAQRWQAVMQAQVGVAAIAQKREGGERERIKGLTLNLSTLIILPHHIYKGIYKMLMGLASIELVTISTCFSLIYNS